MNNNVVRWPAACKTTRGEAGTPRSRGGWTVRGEGRRGSGADLFPLLRRQGSAKVDGHLGGEDMATYDPPDLTTKPIRFQQLKSVLKFDLKDLTAVVGRPLAGIVGMEALRGYIVQIDFDAGRI